MKCVILRDDDTNALTPPEMLDVLYSPFLREGFPIHVAMIPEVKTDIVGPSGRLEGFLVGSDAGKPGRREVTENRELVAYLRAETGYRIAQHGLSHEYVDGYYEFRRSDQADIARRLDRGAQIIRDAGFDSPSTFVAPQDQLSRVAMREVQKRFDVVSTGVYYLQNVPREWWPSYLFQKKVRKQPHWQYGGTTFLTHPGCILSYERNPATIFETLVAEIRKRDVTVIVSHHWEYFHGGTLNEPYASALFELVEYLKRKRDEIRVIRFEDARV